MQACLFQRFATNRLRPRLTRLQVSADAHKARDRTGPVLLPLVDRFDGKEKPLPPMQDQTGGVIGVQRATLLDSHLGHFPA